MIFVAANGQSRCLSALILRIGRKIESLARYESGTPDRARTRISDVRDDAVESDLVVRRRRRIKSPDAKGANRALPDLLAPSLRVHLPEGLLGSGRARSNAG